MYLSNIYTYILFLLNSGLVLQDLTFVHVGNPDYLKEGVVNFSKRWQQYHLIENMKRFKKWFVHETIFYILSFL